MSDTPWTHPDRIEGITPAWLRTVLGPDFADGEIAKVEVLDQHSGTTGRARLRLVYAPGAAGPETIFVKLPPFGEEQRRLVARTDMGRKEARFYAQLAAETPVRAPRPYFAAHGQDPGEYLMLLEDLEAAGCTFTRDAAAYARDHGQQVVESLARLHAHFWEDPRFEGELSWLAPPMRGKLGATLVDAAREQFTGDMPPVFAELCTLYRDHHEAVSDAWEEGASTMVHGDIHAGNQFVDGDRVGFYDWAVISRSPGVRDLGIFLCNSCPPALQREEGERWLRRYLEILVEAGVDAPAFEDLWLRYRRAVLYGWVAATTTAAVGDRWQPLSVSVPAMRRATEICSDLGTLDALREVL